jgi:hypothetical protein
MFLPKIFIIFFFCNVVHHSFRHGILWFDFHSVCQACFLTLEFSLFTVYLIADISGIFTILFILRGSLTPCHFWIYLILFFSITRSTINSSISLAAIQEVCKWGLKLEKSNVNGCIYSPHSK